MGKVARAGDSEAGRAAGVGTKNIGKPRTKRRKRKDLEELHRNVLEAKRNLRMQVPQKKKKRTALGKVLRNFADKRQENEDKSHGFAGKKGRKKESRTICDRLLPDPILGIYQNGAKGRAVQKANPEFNMINAARLQGDVLKLLNGDETNSKFSWDGGEKRAVKAKGSEALPSDESDYASSTGGRMSRADTPVLSETKGAKRVNGKKKTNLTEEEAPDGAKGERKQFRQRENKCKRRLFEPNEDQTDSTCLGNNGNLRNFIIDEIRFSPPRDIAENASSPEDCFRKKHQPKATDLETTKKAEKKLMPIDGTIDANFWGWSPTIYYERLCAMICADNFENNPEEQPRGPDPLVKIRRTLREFYRNACEYRRAVRKTVIARGNKSREQALSKVSFPLENSSFPSSTEIQACTTDTELDQEFSDSEATKVGSWVGRHFSENFDPKDSSFLPDTNVTTRIGSENHNNEIPPQEDKPPAVVDDHDRLSEGTSDRVGKTIHSVSMFLEKLRENNPLNGKGNIFQVEVAAARVSQQKEQSDDCTAEALQRDLTFDMNLRKLVRKSTKHVPTILRRSNSRCADEKQQQQQPPPPPLMSNNWVENVPKRSTRTIAALPRWSPPKHEDSDDLQTPSVVNHLAATNEARANILKSKLHFINAKYGTDARSSPSEYQEHRKTSEKQVANEGKVWENEIFVHAARMNDREWYHADSVHRDQEHAEEPTFDTRGEKRDSRSVHFGKKKDSSVFKESNLRAFDTGFPDVICKYAQPPVRPKNSRCRAKTASNFSSFEFAHSEPSKNCDTRDRRIFHNEITSQRLSGENSEETFVRTRYLPDDSKTSVSTSVSRISNGGPSTSQRVNEIQFLPEEYAESISVRSETNDRLKNRNFHPLPIYRADTSLCASQRVNEIQFLPEEYAERIAMGTEINDRMKNRSFQSLPCYRADISSLDRLPNGSVVGCDQLCRGFNHRQRIRKPVMLFRPIQESRQQRKIANSRYRFRENGDAPINDAVRNLEVLSVNENTKNPSISQFQAHRGREMCHLRYGQQQQQQKHSLPQSHCHIQLIDSRQRHSQNFDKRPSKYLALDETDVGNPRRLPIYVKSDVAKVGNVTADSYNREFEPAKLFETFAKPENADVACSRCHDFDDPRLKHSGEVECRGQQQLEELRPRRASQVTMMLPCPAPLCQRASSTNLPASTAPAVGSPTSIEDVPRVVYSMTACETLVPAEMTYQLEPPLYNRSRYGNESLSKRVQLPDGRVGILVSENCSIDDQECLDRRGGPSLRFDRRDLGNLNTANCRGLSNERIYY